MTTELKKISELSVTIQFDGSESVPLLKSGGNPRTTLADLKEYFRDSTLAIFEEVDNSDALLMLLPFEREEGATFDIVYKVKDQEFVERKTTASGVGYTRAYTRSTDYMDGVNVRTDRVFFNLAEQRLYTWDGSALTDPYAPIVLTQAEYDALPVKDENKTYYIIEA